MVIGRILTHLSENIHVRNNRHSVDSNAKNTVSRIVPISFRVFQRHLIKTVRNGKFVFQWVGVTLGLIKNLLGARTGNSNIGHSRVPRRHITKSIRRIGLIRHPSYTPDHRLRASAIDSFVRRSAGIGCNSRCRGRCRENSRRGCGNGASRNRGRQPSRDSGSPGCCGPRRGRTPSRSARAG
jgi:hypothetical protein